eukprot:scaffold45148_cov23-Tisochrysis_lutea.AAC.3
MRCDSRPKHYRSPGAKIRVGIFPPPPPPNIPRPDAILPHRSRSRRSFPALKEALHSCRSCSKSWRQLLRSLTLAACCSAPPLTPAPLRRASASSLLPHLDRPSELLLHLRVPLGSARLLTRGGNRLAQRHVSESSCAGDGGLPDAPIEERDEERVR